MGAHIFFSICYLKFILNLGFDLWHSNLFYLHNQILIRATIQATPFWGDSLLLLLNATLDFYQ